MKTNSTLARALLALTIAGFGCASGLSARAFEIDLDGVRYNVSYLHTSFNASADLLMTQPWWNSQTLAEEAVREVGAGLGYPNDGGVLTPTYAYSYVPDYGLGFVYFADSDRTGQIYSDYKFGEFDVREYAVAARVSVSDSGGTLSLLPIALVGLAVASYRSGKADKAPEREWR